MKTYRVTDAQLEILRDALEPIPAFDARCHKGVCPQLLCRRCIRLMTAHRLLDNVQGKKER